MIETDFLDEEAGQDRDNWNNKWTGLTYVFPPLLSPELRSQHIQPDVKRENQRIKAPDIQPV